MEMRQTAEYESWFEKLRDLQAKVRIFSRIRRFSFGNFGDMLVILLGDVARAKGMTEIARETGLGRESLYKALSSDGNPEFATVQKVVRSLGLKLHISA
jgi:probable addiction module antidote protein